VAALSPSHGFPIVSSPVLFTIEFRRKMAQLSRRQRQEWLTSLAPQVGASDVRAQELGEVARGCRLSLVESLSRDLGPFDDRHLRALLEVPRERFVRSEDVERSAEDTPLPLDAEGLATISAPHAYLLSFRLLELRRGDALVELGAGSGYGAALAAFIVGGEGRVVTFEIDPVLAGWAKRTLRAERNVEIVEGDAVSNSRQWYGAPKVVVTFAVDAWPDAWLEALPEAGRIVAPVGRNEQRLMLATKSEGRIIESDHGAVRYVKNRSTR
jgi:protein-L-isoaspartate(D-aspartate) O-methyltransferase